MSKITGTFKKQIVSDDGEIILKDFDLECHIHRVLEKDNQTEILLRFSDNQSAIEETLLINGVIHKIEGLVTYLNKFDDFNVYLSDSSI